MELYGIIGKPLGHSFSRKYFTEFFERTGRDASYEPFELSDIAEFPALIAAHPNLVGLNVTLPYKQAVIPYLDALDATATAIGAVNVIKVTHDEDITRLTGYNTDVIGFGRSIRPLLEPRHTEALILGTGGASKAVDYGLKQFGIRTVFVSRTPQEGQLGYADLTPDIISRYCLIVNATPLGTFPDTGRCADIPYTSLDERHLCFDLVYNPEESLFLQKARQQGATTKNGLEMLHLQADAAWEIWNS